MNIIEVLLIIYFAILLIALILSFGGPGGNDESIKPF